MLSRLVSLSPAAARRAARTLLFGAIIVAAGCAPRQSADRGPELPGAEIEKIYVATQRALDHPRQSFGQPRNEELNFFRASISIPPNHEPGQVEWAESGEVPDPREHFIVTDTRVIAGADRFANQVARSARGQETMLFVHGYNNTLSDAMYRLAQMRTDFEITMPTVLFSWLSSGDPRGYIYDRDSVLFARDDLEKVLNRLTSTNGERVLLVAHSMGAHLAMEVMRQAALRGNRQLLSRISGVVLMSPDLDPDLFRSQAEAIGDLPQPFLVFVSRQDRALSLASFITGRKPRLGVIDGPEAVAGLGVKVIDFTALADGEGLNHSVPATSPAAISVLRGMIDQAGGTGNGFEDYMVLEQQPSGGLLSGTSLTPVN